MLGKMMRSIFLFVVAGLLIVPSRNAFCQNEDIMDYEEKTMELLAKIDAFTEDDPVLRADAAKAHYNMGNIYYQKGKYEIASREFYQAVVLMPDDPDAHYNLAYVSAEHLNDFKTAVKHYRQYLYLKPSAPDAPMVKGKIREAELALRAVVDSPLEEDAKKNK